jgi:hypothetical protein
MKHSVLVSFTLIGSLLTPLAWADSDLFLTEASAHQLAANEPNELDQNEPGQNMLGAVATDSALSISRGTDNVTSTNNLGASLYGNSALNTVTGGNFVTNGAFASSTGFSTVVQNSGNNVLIQSALILNLNVQ